ncbi:MAG: DUF58 domain-containing protein, partial [Bifidobacteriaceae bacterium]|nr:DUF58 domain-containing protein [Bifidobacteriaceae bacterium]
MRLRLRAFLFVLVGAALVSLGFRFGRADALLAGVAGLAPPLIAIVGLVFLPRRPRHTRVLPSTLAHAGEVMRVTFQPAATPRAHAGDGVLDRTPAGPHLAVPAGGGALAYEVTLERRGLWHLGPAVIRHADAFGMAFLDDLVAPVSEIAVAPRAATVVLPRLTSENRESASRTLSADRVVDPSTVRVYRHGDPRRLVHWRASLRRDRLMVRGDRPRGHADLWLVVDTVIPPPAFGTHAARVDAAEDALAVATATASAAMRAGHRVHLVETGSGALRDAAAHEFSVAAPGSLGHRVSSNRASSNRASNDRAPGDSPRSRGGAPATAATGAPWPHGLGETLARALGRVRTRLTAWAAARAAIGRVGLGGWREHASTPVGEQGAMPVLDPTHTTEALLRAVAQLDFAPADRPGWHEEILAAAGQSGGPIALIAVVSHTTPARVAALGAAARVADPALAWSSTPAE